MSAQPLDIRMAHLEGAYEQISQRLNGIDLRLAGLEQKIDTQIESLRKSMDSKLLWTMGLILVSIILPLVERYVPLRPL